MARRIVRLIALGALFWGLIGLCSLAHAEQPPPSGGRVAESDGAASAPVPLVFQNRTIFAMRGSLFGYPPRERVEAAEGRIRAAVEKGGPGVVTSKQLSEGIAIEIDGNFVFFVTSSDANALAGETLEALSEKVERNLGIAVAEAREQRNPRLLLIALALAALATVIYAALVFGIFMAERRLGERLSVAIGSHVEKVRIAGITAVSPAQFLVFTRKLVRVVAWLLVLVATYLWLLFVLERFPFTRPLGEGLEFELRSALATVVHGIVSAIPGLLVVVVIFLLTRALSRLIRAFFNQVAVREAKIGWLDADTAETTRRIVTVALWLFALAMAYPYLPGAQTQAFKGLSVLLGLMISLGSTSLVGQVASGLILVYSRTLRSGEYVKIGDTEGTVMGLGIFAIHIETGLGEEVIVPNSYVTANTTRNFSRIGAENGFVLHAVVTIGYSVPWRQVHAMLLEAARRTKGIRSESSPYVIQTALSDFYVEYRLVAYAGPEAPKPRALAMNDLHANVQDVFNQHGVQIMSPHYMVDPPRPQTVPPEHWYEPPAEKTGDGSLSKS